jgi:hypothetical protein
MITNVQLMDDKDNKIGEILELIAEAKKYNDWSKINTSVYKKRKEWYEKNKNKLDLQGTDVRKAYNLLLKKLEINEKEVPIIYESETKITWRSYNWCPVLEACKVGNYFTKEVCKKGWENPTQEFIQLINSSLKFSRNYDKIRPDSQYCEESIELLEK